MLRAVRFAAKLGFRLDPATEAPLHRLGHLLEQIPPPACSTKSLKLFLGGSAIQTFELLRHYRLFGWLFPATERCLNRQQQHYPKTLLVRALADTDNAVWPRASRSIRRSCSPPLLWEPLREQQHQSAERVWMSTKPCKPPSDR
jgi:poly(A) polymerase